MQACSGSVECIPTAVSIAAKRPKIEFADCDSDEDVCDFEPCGGDKNFRFCCPFHIGRSFFVSEGPVAGV